MTDNLIMVVDDSQTVRTSVEYTLSKEGFKVVGAEDGEQGLRLLEELRQQMKRPAMIITDVNMPRMDGISMLREIKKNVWTRFIPVLILTTESQEHKKQEGKNAGAAGWLVKPFKPEQLVYVVKKFVKTDS
ncbi:MAG: two-component system response regulator [Candidatus Reconcilbacillus cellulovorans]|uniref:Two-component system response regulator n=1 Tax=Candidatus Reconcilbacillus cellulovorans TaxID=1906605 RepID=A0A2A6DYA6_9BACL|nr:MAG: two-component system response regulator [Candidatus Reconcilbacillus cellulovorans]